MKNIYLNDFITIKELINLINVNENDFFKLTFLKEIIIKKNEILKFDKVKFLCKKIFNINVLKKNEINLSENINNFFYISIIGNVNSGKTTLIDFIFKKNISLNEVGKITQFVNILEIFFLNKKIFFFDLPGHNLFNKVIETYIKISNLVFLIISIDDKNHNFYKNIKEIIFDKNENLIICINKIDKNKYKKIFFEKFINFKISSINGYGIKNLIKESIKHFFLIKKINFLNYNNDGILINSYYKNNNFIVTFFLLRNNFKSKNFIYFNSKKIFIEKIFVNNNEVLECIAPCIFYTKNVYFPIEFFFSIKNNNLINECLIEEKKYFYNYYIKSENHTICISLLDYFYNIKFNDKINSIIKLGNFNEKDLKICLDFNYKIILIGNKINNYFKKKILKKNIFLKEFEILNDVVEYFNNNYNLNKKEIIVGELIIKEIFPCGKNKKIAGCFVQIGYIDIKNIIKIYKNLKLIFQGKINSLKKKNNSIKIVKINEECGLNIKNFNDIEIGMKIVSIIYE